MRTLKKQIASILIIVLLILSVNTGFNLFSIPVLASSNTVQVATGYYHTLLLKSDGTVWTWGYNGYGELGDGTTESRDTPMKVEGLDNVAYIACGNYHSLAVKTDGTVWTWGYNSQGQLGDNSTTNRLKPVQVHNITNVKSVAGGSGHSLALKNDGTVWAWGYNKYGQLGNNNNSNYYTPVQTYNLYNVKQIQCGENFSVALRNDGYVYSWGYNGSYNLGIGHTSQRNTPQQTTNNIKSISTGSQHTIALKNNGTVWAWGDNSYGQYGNGSTSRNSTPVQISISNVKSIATGDKHSMAIKNDGTVWTWGMNNNGQLGDNSTTNRYSPTRVISLTGVSKLVGGDNFTIALKDDGSVFAWGDNSKGQLTNKSVKSSKPKKVLDNVKSASGYYHWLVQKKDNSIYSWGSNGHSQLGDKTTINNSTPKIINNLNGIKQLATGSNHSVLLREDKTIWAWGLNNSGQLGNGNTSSYNTPIKTNVISDINQVSSGEYFNIALKDDGTVWTWGYNGNGQLGNGNTTNQSNPIKVPNLNNVTQVSAGYYRHSLALKSNGTVWAWGLNDNGQLGDGTTSQRNNPIQINTLLNIKQIASGYRHSVALKKDGTVWAWGLNNYGQIGNGTTSNRNMPIKVVDLDNVIAISSGRYHNMALKEDGTIWAWGYNNNGQLGDGTYQNRTKPVKISSLKNVSQIICGADTTLAILKNGDAYIWGNNSCGQLGDGSVLRSLTPIRANMLFIKFNSASIINKTQQSVQASWTVAGETSGTMYQLAVFDKDDNIIKSNGWMPDFTDTITGLKSGRSYQLKVRAKDGYGIISDWYDIGREDTLYFDINLEIKDIKSKTLNLVINDKSTESVQYQVTSGNKYLSQKGKLVDIPIWITLPQSKTMKVVDLLPDTTYSFRVKSRDSENIESPYSQLVYGRTTVSAPTTPINLSSKESHDSITIMWDPIDEADGYEIDVDGTIVTIDSFTSLSYIHKGLVPNTQHTYRVRPINAGGEGDWSSYISAVTLRKPPIAPTNIKKVFSNTTVTLTWDKVVGASTYEIEADGVVINTGKLAGYKHKKLKPNTQHAYRVRAVNEAGKSYWSPITIVSTTNIPPKVPDNIRAYVSKTVIALSWDELDDADKYQIEFDGQIIDNGLNTYCEKTGLQPTTSHTYRIRAINVAGKSEWSKSKSVDTYLLETPTNITTIETEESITISWASVKDATSYEIEVNGNVVDNANNTTYKHAGLSPESKNSYRIRAKNANGTSSYTGVITTVTLPKKPSIPNNIFLSATQDRITVTWNPVTDAIGYDVELDNILIDNGDRTYYVHDELDYNSAHTYRIRAKTAAIEGDFCNPVIITTLDTKPEAPTNIVLTKATSTIVEIAWPKVNGALGYELEVDGQLMDVGTKTSYVHRRITPNTQHRYRVRTVSTAGVSEWSGEIINNTITAICSRKQDLQLGLTGSNISDFSKYELTVAYNYDVLDVVDLCGFSSEQELTVGNIEGTDINITYFQPGKITFEVGKVLIPGETWVGVINNIIFNPKVTGGTPITYTVYEK
jgi:alpha-tubulin suppressor-like RCC1 family protein